MYYPGLDVARGLAIISVLLYHLFWYTSLFRIGWIGVDLFFVLSGFLITDILLESKKDTHYFYKFYTKRVLRIIPLYYVTLFLFFKLSPIFFSDTSPNSTFTYYNQNKIWYWTFIQNWLIVLKGKPSEPYLLHFWSLAIEEQFYNFWPIIIILTKTLRTLKRIIFVLILFALLLRTLSWLINPENLSGLYYNSFARMDSLLMGCFICVHIKQGQKLSPVFIKTIFLFFFILILSSFITCKNVQPDNFIFSTIGFSIIALFFGCLIYLLVDNEITLAPWINNLQLFSFIGKISYGLYVIHLPVYLIIAHLLSKSPATITPIFLKSSLFVSIISLCCTMLLSVCSFYLFEKPILSFKKYL